MELKERFKELRALKDGWHNGEGRALNKPGCTWLKKAFEIYYPKDLQVPLLFPMLNGNICAEWVIGHVDCSLEISLTERRGIWQSVVHGTNRVKEFTLALSKPYAWEYLVEEIKELTEKVPAPNKPSAVKVLPEIFYKIKKVNDSEIKIKPGESFIVQEREEESTNPWGDFSLGKYTFIVFRKNKEGHIHNYVRYFKTYKALRTFCSKLEFAPDRDYALERMSALKAEINELMETYQIYHGGRTNQSTQRVMAHGLALYPGLVAVPMDTLIRGQSWGS